MPEHDCSEVEIVAEGAELVVDDGGFEWGDFLARSGDCISLSRRGRLRTRADALEMVGIDHLGMGHLEDLKHTLLGAIDPLDVGFCDEERIGCFRLGGDVADEVGRTKTTVEMERSEHF